MEDKEDDESTNNKEMNEFDNDGEFQKVPIVHSIEIINVLKAMNKITRDRFKKKFFKRLLSVIAIIAFLIITKKMIYDGIIKDIIKDNKLENYDKDYLNSTYDDEQEADEEEVFYLHQNLSKINLNSFSSPQFRNPKNIKPIENLTITLNVEYERFVHLKIRDSNKKRWEIPPNETLNLDYIKDINDNKISLSMYSNTLDCGSFYLERIINPEEEEEKNDDENNDKIIYNQEFAFYLKTYEDNEEFYFFNSSHNFLYSDTYINFESRLTSDNIYGFGERTHDFKMNEGTYTIWSSDFSGNRYDDGKGGMNQYSHQPIGLHKTKYENLWLGFVFLNTNAQDVVIKHNKENEQETFLAHKTIGGIIDYYIIVGNHPEEVIKDIQFLLGIPPLPPFWAFGNHQNRYGFKNFEEFRSIYNNYKKYEIPIDAMWIDIDIDAMDNYEVFTLNKHFEKIKPFIKDNIHKDGGNVVPIIDLGLSYKSKKNIYVKLGDSLDIFIKSNYTKKPLIGEGRDGKTLFPDFFNPNIDKFWNKRLNDYYQLVNYDGICLNMNEPTNLLNNSECVGEIVTGDGFTKDKNKYYNNDLPYLPGYRESIKENLSYHSISENAILYGNNTIYNVKPLLALYQSKVTYDFLEKDLKIRPFILSRSTTIGSGKYAFHWLGENYSSYRNLKNSISGIFNFNIFGIPFSGSDICGFKGNANKELCIRWYNLGVFYPFMRNHNSKESINQYPWSFIDNDKNLDIIQIIKKDINIRYSLLRYMYSQFFLISLNEKGSFFKPVMFEFPEEQGSYIDIESKIMFGEAFLIFAFYEDNENEKQFEFPNDNFNKYPKGKKVMNFGAKNHLVTYLGKYNKTRIFMRGGYIVPYQNTWDKYILNTRKLREEKLNLIINIDNYRQSKGVIFFDNDGVDSIKKGKYIRVDLLYDEKELSISTNKNNLEKYDYDDHILGRIELWRANEIFEVDEEDIKVKIKIVYNNKNNQKEIFDGIFDKEYNKAVFDISDNEQTISIFDINEIIFDYID